MLLRTLSRSTKSITTCNAENAERLIGLVSTGSQGHALHGTALMVHLALLQGQRPTWYGLQDDHDVQPVMPPEGWLSCRWWCQLRQMLWHWQWIHQELSLLRTLQPQCQVSMTLARCYLACGMLAHLQESHERAVQHDALIAGCRCHEGMMPLCLLNDMFNAAQSRAG